MKTRIFTLMTGLLLACGGQQADVVVGETTSLVGPSFEEFKSYAYQEPDTGVWIANGDEVFETEDALKAFWAEYFPEGEQLAIMYRSGADVKVPSTVKMNITYCIDARSFGSKYSTIANAAASATAAWEGTGAKVNYVYVSSQDSNCNSRNTNVWFNIRMVNSGCQYLARAFFPDASRRNREVLVDACAFNYGNAPSPTGVLRHELGHTLGFRHEHTRPEAGTCYEDNQWRALTPYDVNSVMHYPQCNGSGKWDLSLTSYDKQGAQIAYP
jgi:type IV pilus biogenesis protein CpaD/CtpE